MIYLFTVTSPYWIEGDYFYNTTTKLYTVFSKNYGDPVFILENNKLSSYKSFMLYKPIICTYRYISYADSKIKEEDALIIDLENAILELILNKI